MNHKSNVSLNVEIFELTKKYSSIIDEESAIIAKRIKVQFYRDVVPMFYQDFDGTANKILFVGINPSLTEKSYKELRKRKIHLFSELVKAINELNQIINQLIEYQNSLKYGIERIPYFTIIDKFTTELELGYDWDHYDLYSFRGTQQNLTTKLVVQEELRGYHRASMERFDNLINNIKFKAIISLNRHVSEIIHNEFELKKMDVGHQYAFRNDIYGFYKYKSMPFYLFKQLSGGGTTREEKGKFMDLIKRTIEV